MHFWPYFYAILRLIIYYLCSIGDKGFTGKVELSQLLTQLEGPGGHKVKKRKARQRKKKEEEAELCQKKRNKRKEVCFGRGSYLWA